MLRDEIYLRSKVTPKGKGSERQGLTLVLR